VTSVAFIGLGNIGIGMAQRLLAAGHDLRVYNRTRSKAVPLEHAGARVCATPREACEGAEAVIAMTADDDSSRSVWLGPDGVLAAQLVPRALAIECSTLSHDWVLELAAKSQARDLRYLDAPVTGLPEHAASGTLTLLVGAEAADLAAARPLLGAISKRILRFGGVGTGTAYKLIINMIGAVQIASVAEGMALAEKAGFRAGKNPPPLARRRRSERALAFEYDPPPRSFPISSPRICSTRSRSASSCSTPNSALSTRTARRRTPSPSGSIKRVVGRSRILSANQSAWSRPCDASWKPVYALQTANTLPGRWDLCTMPVVWT
jgi:3-hydroxyisobutyrate dehydrogenase-like beta-hydroxyacid dehydrogenase